MLKYAYSAGIQIAWMEKTGQLPALLKRTSLLQRLRNLLRTGSRAEAPTLLRRQPSAGRYFPQDPRTTAMLEEGIHPAKQLREITVPEMGMVRAPSGLKGYNPTITRLQEGSFRITPQEGWSFGQSPAVTPRPSPPALHRWMSTPGGKQQIAVLREPAVVTSHSVKGSPMLEGWAY